MSPVVPESNRIRLVLFGMQDRTSGPYLAALIVPNLFRFVALACAIPVAPLAHVAAPQRGSRGLVVWPQVILAAGDTFRAAAEEQLATWAERSGADLVGKRSEKQRPDALLYEAVDRGAKEDADVSCTGQISEGTAARHRHDKAVSLRPLPQGTRMGVCLRTLLSLFLGIEWPCRCTSG
jgi:SRP54-type protein, GTPase domain